MVFGVRTVAFLIFMQLLVIQAPSSSCRQDSANSNANSSPQEVRGSEKRTENSKAGEAEVTPTQTSKNMSNSSTQKTNTLPTGTWGGAHIRLRVTPDGADVEYDCANGTIVGPLTMNKDGKFELLGTHRREGGPIRIDRKAQGRRARYVGQVEGKQMTLTVTLSEPEQEVGTFTLNHGSEGRLWKCY